MARSLSPADWSDLFATADAVARRLVRASDRSRSITADDIAAAAVVDVAERDDPADAASVGRAVGRALAKARYAADRVVLLADPADVLDGTGTADDDDGTADGPTSTDYDGPADYWCHQSDGTAPRPPDYTATDDDVATLRAADRSRQLRRLLVRSQRTDVLAVADWSRWSMRPADDVRDFLLRTTALRDWSAADWSPRPTDVTTSRSDDDDLAAALWSALVGSSDPGTVVSSAYVAPTYYERRTTDEDGTVHAVGTVKTSRDLDWPTLYRRVEHATRCRLSTYERRTLRALVRLWAAHVAAAARCAAPVVTDDAERADVLARTALATLWHAVPSERRALAGIGRLVGTVRPDYLPRPTAAVRDALLLAAADLVTAADRAATLALARSDDACQCVRCREVGPVRTAARLSRWHRGRRFAAVRASRGRPTLRPLSDYGTAALSDAVADVRRSAARSYRSAVGTALAAALVGLVRPTTARLLPTTDGTVDRPTTADDVYRIASGYVGRYWRDAHWSERVARPTVAPRTLTGTGPADIAATLALSLQGAAVVRPTSYVRADGTHSVRRTYVQWHAVDWYADDDTTAAVRAVLASCRAVVAAYDRPSLTVGPTDLTAAVVALVGFLGRFLTATDGTAGRRPTTRQRRARSAVAAATIAAVAADSRDDRAAAATATADAAAAVLARLRG